MRVRRYGAIAQFLPAIVSLTLGCRGPADVEPEPTPSCLAGEFIPWPSDTVRIAVSRRVDAPVSSPPADDDALLVYKQLYESLVTLDCHGNVVPGLASGWEAHDGGREWRFTMRAGATYWDGIPVSIVDVIESWERNWSAIESLVPAGQYFNIADAISHDRLVVRLEEPDSMFPRHLTRPELAVSRPVESMAEWAVGTGLYRPEVGGQEPDGSLVVHPIAANRPSLHFIPIGNADTRDALDAGFDAVLGRERNAVAYVRSREDYSDTPLAWDLTYAFVVLPDLFVNREGGPDVSRLALLRQEMVHDVVRIDARPSSCEPKVGGTTVDDEASTSRDQLAYEYEDQTARVIAERLVAAMGSLSIGLAGIRRVLVSDGREPMEYVRSGTAAGAVVRYEYRPDCGTLAITPKDFEGLTVVPLLDVRRHLFFRKGKIWARLDADGVPLFFADRSP